MIKLVILGLVSSRYAPARAFTLPCATARFGTDEFSSNAAVFIRNYGERLRKLLGGFISVKPQPKRSCSARHKPLETFSVSKRSRSRKAVRQMRRSLQLRPQLASSAVGHTAKQCA